VRSLLKSRDNHLNVEVDIRPNLTLPSFGDLNLNWGSAFEDRETSVLFCFRRDDVPVYLRGAKMEREAEMEHGRHFPL